jgi:flagellar hook-associated protein 3 FlgL
MRVTSNMMIERAVRDMNASLRRLRDLQVQIASGKRVTKPSDDAFAAEQALGMRSVLRANESYQHSIDLATSWLNATEHSIATITEIMSRVSVLALSASNDTIGPGEREAIAVEVDELLAHAVQAGNTQHQGRYILAGFQTNAEPFTLEADLSVTYHGDGGAIRREIGPGETMQVNIPGDEALAEVFAALRSFSQALRNDPSAIEACRSEIEAAADHLAMLTATVGTRVRNLQDRQQRLTAVDTAIREQLSKIEDIDQAEALMYLANQGAAYQALLQVAADLPQATLFEHLR